jgi:peptide subunit release factor 1 (eRF1)
MLELSRVQFLEAIENLYEALKILESVRKEIESGAMRGMVISENLAEAWYKVNCCRLHTQEDVNLEELTLEAMGLINDAKCMIDSLLSWKKGMTRQAKIFIMDDISYGARNIFLVLSHLEDWLSKLEDEGDLTASS